MSVVRSSVDGAIHPFPYNNNKTFPTYPYGPGMVIAASTLVFFVLCIKETDDALARQIQALQLALDDDEVQSFNFSDRRVIKKR